MICCQNEEMVHGEYQRREQKTNLIDENQFSPNQDGKYAQLQNNILLIFLNIESTHTHTHILRKTLHR
jgi:hypothetical protein